MNQLSVSKPVDLYKNDAWKNKSELYFFSQGSSEYSINTADLTSCAPSLGYSFSLGNSFCSSSIQASYYDHQSYRGDDANLTSRAPSFGYYEYSITTADLTSFFCSSSIQASYYDHQSYRGDDANLTSRAPSFAGMMLT
jgi:hypothetical protein